MGKPFEMIADRPQWQIVFDHLSTMEIGDTVTDRALRDLLPDAPAGSINSAFHRAVKQVEDDLSRTFSRIRCEGYRMVEAVEHERLARGQHKRARRRLSAASRKIRSADRSLLTAEDRQRFDAMERNIGQQAEMLRRLDARVEKTESELKDVRRTEKANNAEVIERLDQLTALLERHGIVGDPEPARLKAA